MICVRCGSTHNVCSHEPLMGKNRKLSIKYNLQVPLCFNCHRFAHDQPSQLYNDSLKVEMQLKFTEEFPELDFIKIFGRNYL